MLGGIYTNSIDFIGEYGKKFLFYLWQEIDQTSAALQQSVDPSISSGKSPYIPSHFSHGGAHSLASTKSSERRKDPNSQEHPPFFFHRIDQGEKDKDDKGEESEDGNEGDDKENKEDQGNKDES